MPEQLIPARMDTFKRSQRIFSKRKTAATRTRDRRMKNTCYTSIIGLRMQVIFDAQRVPV